MINKLSNFNQTLQFKRTQWSQYDIQYKETYDKIMKDLNPDYWIITIKTLGRLPVPEYLVKAEEMMGQGRCIEVAETMTEVINKILYTLDKSKTSFEDLFLKLIYLSDDKKSLIDTVEDSMSEIVDENQRLRLENDRLKLEVERLNNLHTFSISSYYEFWKLIESKMDNLTQLYQGIINAKSVVEMKSMIDAIKVEIQASLKPLDIKKNNLLTQQADHLGINAQELGVPEFVDPDDMPDVELSPLDKAMDKFAQSKVDEIEEEGEDTGIEVGNKKYVPPKPKKKNSRPPRKLNKYISPDIEDRLDEVDEES